MPLSRLCHHLWTDDEPAFIFTNITTGASETFTLPLEATGSYNFTVIWGDGNVEKISAWDDAKVTHTYASAGTYTVIIRGEITGWRFNNGGDKTKIYDIIEWGPLRLGNNNGYFQGCVNLTVSATDILDLTGTTTFRDAFYDCSSLATVPSMNEWDISNITSTYAMFYNCQLFTQDISNWDVSSVTSMYLTFYNCKVFDQDISGWDTSIVELMQHMFDGCTIFNQDIGGWDVSSVISFANTFNSAIAFNQDIGGWDVSSVTNLTYMFTDATSFDQDISGWDVSNVTNFSGMFYYATAFNQPLAAWNVSAATTMESMFGGATAFNQSLAAWNVSAVTNLNNMFEGATAFDQDIGSWVVTALTQAYWMFDGVTLSTANYDSLLTGWEGEAVLNNVTFHGGSSKYSAGAAATARQALIDDHTWDIIDGGQA